MEIEIIWCDDDIILINKPAGLLTIRDGYDPTLPYAAGILQSNYGKLFVVHRLDRDTSGILLLARNAQSHRNLNEQFQNRQTQKTYHAIVQGVPSWDEFHAEYPLQIDGDRRHRTKVDYEKGKLALTDFNVMKRFSSQSLIKALPHTGYTHQIRAHLLAAGFPILEDLLYSQPRPPSASKANNLQEPKIIRRMALHAFSLSFIHPTADTVLRFEAPHPKDFEDALVYLRQTL
jgi:RluA family pseudouridine synthase